MSTNYRRCYEILQLETSASWEELRKHYKHLVQNCHPDRFQDDPEVLKEAESNLRALNTAYGVLEEYYKRNKRLPFGRDSSHTDWQFQNTSEVMDREEHGQAARRSPMRDIRVSQWVVFAVPASVILLLVGFLVAHSDGEDGAEPVPVEDAVADVPNPIPQTLFGYGDTRKQVLSIQGQPTSMSENTWFYGKSLVSFENGHVVSWKQHVDYPLRVRGEALGIEARRGGEKRLIQLGDAKDDVLGIQGEPIMKSEQRWEYGPSYVEFSDGRVVRWHSSVLHPLKVGQPDARED